MSSPTYWAIPKSASTKVLALVAPQDVGWLDVLVRDVQVVEHHAAADVFFQPEQPPAAVVGVPETDW